MGYEIRFKGYNPSSFEELALHRDLGMLLGDQEGRLLCSVSRETSGFRIRAELTTSFFSLVTSSEGQALLPTLKDLINDCYRHINEQLRLRKEQGELPTGRRLAVGSAFDAEWKGEIPVTNKLDGK